MPQLTARRISDETAREMLRRATAAEQNVYPNSSNGYAVSVLTDKGTIYEGISYK